MKYYDELNEKVVLITGGTQGIGEAITDCFTFQNSKVAINGRKLDDKVQKVIERTGAYPIMGDISNVDRAAEIVRETIAKFGKIDILVANGAAMSMSPFLEQSEEEWWQQINVNLTGHIACIKAALPNMISNGGGSIIILSSFFGTLGWKNATGYGSSKSGLLTLGQYLSREYKKYGINVGIVIPGVIRTPQLNVDAKDLGISYDEVCDMYASEIAMARLGDPQEIASLVAFMSTEVGGRGLSGRHVQVSGGEYRTTPYYV